MLVAKMALWIVIAYVSVRLAKIAIEWLKEALDDLRPPTRRRKTRRRDVDIDLDDIDDI